VHSKPYTFCPTFVFRSHEIFYTVRITIGQNRAYGRLEEFRGNCVRVDYELSRAPNSNTSVWKLKERNYPLPRNNRDNSTDRILPRRTPGMKYSSSQKPKTFHSYEPLCLKVCTPKRIQKELRFV
jgi:hypothetical protein